MVVVLPGQSDVLDATIRRDTLSVGIIGCGYWGQNLVRNFFESPLSTVSSICDLDADKLRAIHDRYPTASLTQDYRELLNDGTVDAVCIATEASTHYELAKKALVAGKHVWVEKPLSLHYSEAQELTNLAAKRNLVLMVDHTFIYTSAVQRMRDCVLENELGDLLYYDSVRVNLGLYNHDINVLWDLAVHDFSIMDYLVYKRPIAVSASAAAHLGAGSSESLAYVTLYFDDTFIAHVHVNWLAPVKIRLTTLCGSQRMIVYDDTIPSEKVKIYDRGITIRDTPRDSESMTRLQVDYRTGDMYAPMLDSGEALQRGARHFAECISRGTPAMTDGEAGSRIVSLLEASQKSLTANGARERIDW